MGSSFTIFAGFAGGLGLFLLGMWLMTEGLKLAAGRALERILGMWTRTRFRGLLAGILVTSVVQSSSAVTVAAIGFVNAGLLSFTRSVWVIFGSNVGTTMTGWLVALIGINVKIEAFALPLIGLGMVLRLTGEGTRRGAFGSAAAGFGTLFLGINILKETFTGIGQGIQLGDLEEFGMLATLAYVLAGVVLTVLMQSSSAALAIALTAAAGGLIPLTAAAAVVIGANVGTTVTALIAAIGATSNAKRAAAAHVMFNLLTGIVALLMLPILLTAIDALRQALNLDPAPATALALFHTVFNILGILLMWPIADRLVQALERRFRTADEDAATPRFLDANIAAVPALAVDALRREIQRLGAIVLRMAQSALSIEAHGSLALNRDKAVVDKLVITIGEFTARVNRASMAEESAQRLPELLRVARYYDVAAELAVEYSEHQLQVESLTNPRIAEQIAEVKRSAVDLLGAADTAVESFSLAQCEAGLEDLQRYYQVLKAKLLEAGAEGILSVVQMELLLQQMSIARRACEQAVKAARYLHAGPAFVPIRGG